MSWSRRRRQAAPRLSFVVRRRERRDMARLPCFDSAQLEAVWKVLADTTHGLKGDEIGYILADMRIADPDVGGTKWKRLFNALGLAQNTHGVGNHLLMFINRAMAPARYLSTPELFQCAATG